MKVRTTAYKAKDESLHFKEEDQVKRDIEILGEEINVVFEDMAKDLSAEAPYVDDWRAQAISGPEEFKTMLQSLFFNQNKKAREVFRLQARLDAFQRRLDKLSGADRDPDARDEDEDDEFDTTSPPSIKKKRGARA